MNYTKTEAFIKEKIHLVNYLHVIGLEKVRTEIVKGLQATSKVISPKFFYDQKGSELFENITELDEYYPTRTERSILSTIVNELNIDFYGLNIIELGSGDASKIRLLLKQIPEEVLSTIKYYPLDISRSAIEKSAMELTDEFPSIEINGIVADFIHQINVVPKTGKRLFCFFGSTIGNLDMSEVKEFMELLGSEMQADDSLLLGLDMVKDIAVLEKAYNDDQRITADFNKNILNVVNSLAGTDMDPEKFEHLAFYNKEKNRIEMHLKAMKDMVVTFSTEADSIYIKKGETIHTENSHKFSRKDIKTMGSLAGLNVEQIFTDKHQWFSLVHYRK
jgi:L-histidine N-alpha-methyltransferase